MPAAHALKKECKRHKRPHPRPYDIHDQSAGLHQIETAVDALGACVRVCTTLSMSLAWCFFFSHAANKQRSKHTPPPAPVMMPMGSSFAEAGV